MNHTIELQYNPNAETCDCGRVHKFALKGDSNVVWFDGDKRRTGTIVEDNIFSLVVKQND